MSSASAMVAVLLGSVLVLQIWRLRRLKREAPEQYERLFSSSNLKSAFTTMGPIALLLVALVVGTSMLL